MATQPSIFRSANQQDEGPFLGLLGQSAYEDPRVKAAREQPSGYEHPVGTAMFLASQFGKGAAQGRLNSFMMKEHQKDLEWQAYLDLAHLKLKDENLTPEKRTELEQEIATRNIQRTLHETKGQEKKNPLAGVLRGILSGFVGGEMPQGKNPIDTREATTQLIQMTNDPAGRQSTHIQEARDEAQKLANALIQSKGGRADDVTQMEFQRTLGPVLDRVQRYAPAYFDTFKQSLAGQFRQVGSFEDELLRKAMGEGGGAGLGLGFQGPESGSRQVGQPPAGNEDPEGRYGAEPTTAAPPIPGAQGTAPIGQLTPAQLLVERKFHGERGMRAVYGQDGKERLVQIHPATGKLVEPGTNTPVDESKWSINKPEFAQEGTLYHPTDHTAPGKSAYKYQGRYYYDPAHSVPIENSPLKGYVETKAVAPDRTFEIIAARDRADAQQTVRSMTTTYPGRLTSIEGDYARTMQKIRADNPNLGTANVVIPPSVQRQIAEADMDRRNKSQALYESIITAIDAQAGTLTADEIAAKKRAIKPPEFIVPRGASDSKLDAPPATPPIAGRGRKPSDRR